MKIIIRLFKKIDNILWKYFGRMCQLLVVIISFEIMKWITPYVYPWELTFYGIISMITIWPFYFFSVLHDYLNDKVDPVWRM